MRFSKTESSKRGGTVSATLPQSLAIRFASAMLAAVLTASFMPVAAFADEGGTSDSEGVQNPPVQTGETQQGEQPAESEAPAEPEAPAAPETPADPDQPAVPESPEATELQAPAQQPEADAPEAPSATKDESKEKSSKKDEDEELSTFKSESYTMKVGDKIDLEGSTAATHSWSVDKPGIVEISENGKTAAVTAIAPGKAVVKHKGLLITDTFTITVTSSDIKDNVTLKTANVDVPYDGNAHRAGVAAATDLSGNDVTIEYSADDGKSWTADPFSITATDVSDSKTVRVRASVPGVYEGYVEETEELTVGKRPVTATGEGFDSIQPYTKMEYSKDTYTFDNVVVGQEASISYQLKGTDPGSYTGEFGDDFAVTANGADVTANYKLAGTVPGTLTIVDALTPGQSIALSVGDTITLEGTRYMIDHNWSVSKEGVIDLEPDGSSATVKAIAPGEVTVSHEGLLLNDTFTIKVVKADISGKVALEPTDVTVEYDGNAHTAGVAAATDLSGNDVTIEYSADDGKSWTADPFSITATDVSDSKTVRVRASVPGVYEGYVEGTEELTVGKRPVTATGEGFEGDQPYTGKEYSKTGCTFSNLVDGQEASITYALRGTGIGTYEGVFGDDFKVMADGKDVTANYELVEKVPGKLTIVEGDPDTPVDPDKPSSDKPSKTTGKTTATKATAAKPASKSAKTGDGIALYAMGICGVAIAAGAVAFVSRRKRNSNK